MNASEAGKMECVRVLLDCGVQVNVQNEVSADFFAQGNRCMRKR